MSFGIASRRGPVRPAGVLTPLFVPLVALLLALLLAPACGGSHDAAGVSGDVECARVDAANLALSVDGACTVASHELAHRFLPDLTFTPGLCYSTGSVPVQVVGGNGTAVDLEVTAFSGIDTNDVAGAALAPFPVPLVDAKGGSHVYIAFTAASVIEVRTPGGDQVGALVTRDAGWAEIKPPQTLPSFVSERLSIAGTSGDLFAGVVGEVLASGDEFGGLPAHGSLCGPGLVTRLTRLGP